MTIQTLFKSNQLSSNYIFRSGKVANFVHGRFSTDMQSEIDELESEIKLGHPNIFKDSKEATIDTEKLDPLWRIKENIRAEILADIAKNNDPNRDMGSYNSGKLNAASTRDIESVAAGAGPSISPAMATLLAKSKNLSPSAQVAQNTEESKTQVE
jgi:hypothetical protein